MSHTREEEEWAYDYLRFSDPKQEKGDSARRQSSPIPGWLERHPGVRLDLSLKLEDRGVSGFTGEHRKDPKFAMARFLHHVETGRVKAGSYLLVENLDRMTREHPVHAIPWVLGLIGKGIRVVQFTPFEVCYEADMDQGKLMALLFGLARGHEESKMKSIRVGEAWSAKREAAREGKPFGSTVPAWIELREGKYRLKPGPARVVRTIFRWSARGLGLKAILGQLVSEGHQPFGHSGRWTKSYLSRILTSRAAMGEWQPMKGSKGRKPDGPPIPGYFPAAVSEKEWYAAHTARQARLKRSGRPSRKGGAATPFSGLLHSAVNGTKLWVQDTHGQPFLLSANAHDGQEYAGCRSFRVDHFVAGLLSQLEELAASELFDDPGAAQVEVCRAKIQDMEGLLNVAFARFEADKGSAAWADRIDEYDRELRSLREELREAQRRAASPLSSAWNETVELMRQNDPARLRQGLLSTISQVWCLFASKDRLRLAVVQVWFAGGETRRDYAILSYTPTGWVARKERGWWKARSLREVLSVDLDLRNLEQAKAMLEIMGERDWGADFAE